MGMHCYFFNCKYMKFLCVKISGAMYCSNILLHGCSATIQTSTIINEHYQNESSVKEVQALGNKTPPMTIYCASKSLAEKVFFLS